MTENLLLLCISIFICKRSCGIHICFFGLHEFIAMGILIAVHDDL